MEARKQRSAEHCPAPLLLAPGPHMLGARTGSNTESSGLRLVSLGILRDAAVDGSC